MLVKFIKRFFVVIYILIFLSIIAFQLWLESTKLGFPTSSLIYWMIFFGWVFSVWNFKAKSFLTLKMAFVLFIIAAIFVTFNLRGVGETIMRISFIGWIVGIVQAFIEYKKE